MKVFLSYRRADSTGHTGRLDDALTAQGVEVFRDFGDIEAGEAFMEVIGEKLAEADVVLAIMGPGWGEELARREDEGKTDYVRLELEAALGQGKPVYPVLVGGADFPGSLPESLSSLGALNAFELTERRWRQDVQDLVRRLRGEAVLDQGKAWHTVVAGGVLGLLAVLEVSLTLQGSGRRLEPVVVLTLLAGTLGVLGLAWFRPGRPVLGGRRAVATLGVLTGLFGALMVLELLA